MDKELQQHINVILKRIGIILDRVIAILDRELEDEDA